MNKSESNRELARVAELKQGAEAVEFILAGLLKDLTAWAAPGLNLWLNGAVGDAGPLMEIAGPAPPTARLCAAARPVRDDQVVVQLEKQLAVCAALIPLGGARGSMKRQPDQGPLINGGTRDPLHMRINNSASLISPF